MDATLKDIFSQVERYVLPLIGSYQGTSFSKDENQVLALQQINRLNQRIGQIARSSKSNVGEMKILQTYINGLTIGVKTENIPQIRATMARAKSFIEI